MRWTKGKLKTLIDEARHPGEICEAAGEFIQKLDSGVTKKTRKKKKVSFLDWLLGEE